MLRVGIDVGGTNTDAVLMDGNRPVEWVKMNNSADITTGIVAALNQLLAQTHVATDQIGAEIRRRTIRHVAISAVFSPINAQMEQQAAEIIGAGVPDARITLSEEIGRIGLLERENAAILNACLQELGSRTVAAYGDALAAAGIAAPLFLTQNDGTLMSAEYAQRFPVLTFASGPTNSMRGAAFLSGLQEALVVDIGGTTTDVGALQHGFPREAGVAVEVGGVRTNFRIADGRRVG